MTLFREVALAQCVRRLLKGVRTGDVVSPPPLVFENGRASFGGEPADFYAVGSDLEFFVPQVVCEIHPEFGPRPFDGVFCYEMRKTAPLQLSYIGSVIFIDSQRLAAFHTELRVARHADLVDWCLCRVGEVDSRGHMKDYDYHSGPTAKIAQTIINAGPQMRWRWSVEYGERQPSSVSEES
ncbi:hypothetical protein [Planctomyces sp. SH-PL14]|uniref:hypothetical protein n=1 Tax=Planctomyces sp. SH-PL14 TaxID=1632864 RepID=UPI00078C240E|nr:hypothetical protein [Planctomyces sp. SH-PL14]AMV19269.1 hypothetical protein VT03_15365 [Planctomyces sp. SH-PL14]